MPMYLSAGKKLVITATHGDEDAERATNPFVMANAALASDTRASVILRTTGVSPTVKRCTKHVKAEGFPPLAKLLGDFLQMGGRRLVCAPYIKSRNIGEQELIRARRRSPREPWWSMQPRWMRR
jgi:predicted peroxiredoxin